MNRNIAVVAGLVVLGILLVWWFLLYSPKGDEIADVEQQIEDTKAQQVQAQNRINALKETRLRAPEIEAQINAADAIIPGDPALPAALRQLQMAADSAGVELPTIAISRPGEEEGANPMTVALSVNGSYFQVIDFLRRTEDPTIVPRGLLWSSLSLSPSNYPTLTAALSGQMFARFVPADVVDLETVVVDEDGEPDDEAEVEVEEEEAA